MELRRFSRPRFLQARVATTLHARHYFRAKKLLGSKQLGTSPLSMTHFHGRRACFFHLRHHFRYIHAQKRFHASCAMNARHSAFEILARRVRYGMPTDIPKPEMLISSREYRLDFRLRRHLRIFLNVAFLVSRRRAYFASHTTHHLTVGRMPGFSRLYDGFHARFT